MKAKNTERLQQVLDALAYHGSEYRVLSLPAEQAVAGAMGTIKRVIASEAKPLPIFKAPAKRKARKKVK